MPDLAPIDCDEQPVTGTGVVENEGSVGKLDCSRQIGQASGIAAQDDLAWNVVPATGDTPSHAGERGESFSKAYTAQNPTTHPRRRPPPHTPLADDTGHHKRRRPNYPTHTRDAGAKSPQGPGCTNTLSPRARARSARPKAYPARP